MTIERSEPSDRMSQSVVHGDTIYLCGQVPDSLDADITVQTQEMLAKVDELLVDAGSSREHMLSATLYISTRDDLAGMNAVWDAWVPKGNPPARACVQAQMGRPEILIEVSVIAAKK